MTLTDNLADAERRAREAIRDAIREHVDLNNAWPVPVWVSVDRYAAVCRLAGRWDEHQTPSDCRRECKAEARIATELAKLMEGL